MLIIKKKHIIKRVPTCISILKTSSPFKMAWQQAVKGETVVAALTRLDEDIASSERTQPAARLAVVTTEIESIQQVCPPTYSLMSITVLPAPQKTQRCLGVDGVYR